jgi:ribonuclease P protein component
LLDKRHRLTRKADFDRVFAAARPAHHELLSLRAVPGETELPRVGIICGKRVGGAVVRNRARRRLREAVRSLLPEVPQPWDILLVIRPPAASATVGQFVYALKDLLRRRGLLVDAREE